MSLRNWTAAIGAFRAAQNWSPGSVPLAGDTLYLQTGISILRNGAFGSATTPTAIALLGGAPATSPVLILQNVTLNNVRISEAPPTYIGPVSGAPPGYYSAKYGTITVRGVVTNNGGVMEGGRDSLTPDANLSIQMAPGSTLVNKGVLAAFPGGQLTISGSATNKLENDGSINAAGGTVTIATRLMGVGSSYTSAAAGGSLSGRIEINAAVDAGQTFHISQGSLQVDKPLSFLGQIDLGPTQFGGTVFLERLNAASWDMRGDLLELFNKAGSVVDTLQFTTPETQATLLVSIKPSVTHGHVVSITASHPFSQPPAGFSILPYHTVAG